jgi:hypothetical protein
VARFLIRRTSGGEKRTIPDTAWPYFESQGYVVIDTLDDESDTPPLYLSAAESDLRYAHVGDIGDPDSPTGSELRTFLEARIDRSSATTGQVPVLQADGSLAFGAGGGGAGTVTSVGGVDPDGSGDVPLTLDDVDDGATYVRLTAAQLEQLLLVLEHGVVMLRHTGGADPERYATNMHVFWDVPDGNRPATDGTTAGGDYAAVDGHDYIAAG